MKQTVIALNDQVDILNKAKEDRDLQAELIKIAEPYLAKMCIKIFRTRDIEDNLQEAKLAFLKAVKTYDSQRGKFSIYMSSVVRNRLITILHKENRQRTVSLEDVSIEGDIADYDIEYLKEKFSEEEWRFISEAYLMKRGKTELQSMFHLTESDYIRYRRFLLRKMRGCFR